MQKQNIDVFEFKEDHNPQKTDGDGHKLYKDKNGKLSTDDYIIGIKEFGKEYDASDLDANGFYKIKGWGDLLKIFKELDSKEHRFQFEFYDYDKDTLAINYIKKMNKPIVIATDGRVQVV